MAVEARDRRAAERTWSRLALDHDPRLLDVPDACAQGIGGACGDAMDRPGRARQRARHGDGAREEPEATAAQHEEERRQHHE